MMDWEKLKQFYYVAKLSNFTRAGTRLNVSPSALSRNIKILEQQLNRTLFQRNTRGASLTRQGELLLTHVSHMMLSYEKAQKILLDETSGPKGDFKITATYGIANLYIAPILTTFIKAYPELRISLFSNDNPPSLDLCDTDIAIYPFMPHHKNYIQSHMITLHLGLYASPEYLGRFGCPQTINDLNQHHLIGYGDYKNHPFSNTNWHLTIGMPKNQSRHAYACANSTIARCHMAEQGLGIITIPQEHPGLKRLNLIQVLSHLEGPTIELYYIYSRQLKNSKRIELFKDFINSHLKAYIKS